MAPIFGRSKSTNKRFGDTHHIMSIDAAFEYKSETDREALYHAVLRTIAYQTSEKQSPGVRVDTLLLTLVDHAGHDRDAIMRALKAAVDEDVLVWRDAEGRRRLTLKTEDDLQRLVGHLNGLDADPEAIERVVDAIREVRDD